MARRGIEPARLDGSTALITGAARGIGAAAARRLHERGANVALVGLEPAQMEALAAQLGERAVWFEADVVDFEALRRAADATAERFGAIDIAIANAGIQMMGSLADSPAEQIERTLEVNLFGTWRTDRAVLPHLMASRGYLLNVASLAAASHQPMMGAYASSKAAVEAMTDSLRLELAPDGVAVGCAYFGFIDTDLVRGAFADPVTKRLHGLMPGFVGRPAPLRAAIDAIEDGVAHRRHRVWAPRFVGPALALRGLIQPISERRLMRDPRLREAVEMARRGEAGGPAQDPLLGISAAGRRDDQ